MTENPTRRDALKAAAGLLVSFILPAPRKHLDLLDFCHPWSNDARYDLRRPWELREFTYATNGGICVRVRPESGDVTTGRAKMPPFGKLGWDHERLRGWRPLPELAPQLAADSDCPACSGSGFVGGALAAACQRCDGSGYKLAGGDVGHELPCRACCGCGNLPPAGVPQCSACDGHAIGTFPTVVRLGGLYFDAGLYAKAQRLGGDFVSFSSDDVPLAFRFDGGDGLLMPLDTKTAEGRLAQAARA